MILLACDLVFPRIPVGLHERKLATVETAILAFAEDGGGAASSLAS
jgi:hypothetical protein